MTSSEVIKKARKKTGLNQTEFASLLGINQQEISLYEIGKRHPGKSGLLLFECLLSDQLRPQILTFLKEK